MLVLSRKVGERIQIGDNITVVINRIAGNRVTIGIEAPHDLRIVRKELEIVDGSIVDTSEEREEVPVAAGSRISQNDFLPKPLSAFRRPR